MSETTNLLPTTGLEESDTEAPLLNSASDKGKNSTVHDILTWTMTALGWSPVVIINVIDNKKIALTTAAGIALLNFCLSGVFYKLGGTKCWPKILDITLMCSFGLLTILALTCSREVVADIVPYMDVFIFGGFVISIGSAWACFGVLFAEQSMTDFVTDAEMAHPATQYIIKKNTQMFLAGFSLMTGIALIIGSLALADSLSTTLKIVLGVIEYSVLVLMLMISFWLLPEYVFSDKGQDMVSREYATELEEWKAKNPDHEWSQE